MSKRAAGILLPITSLPSKYGIGCFSKAAYDFVDWLKDAGQTFWQILPICPTSFGDSPYQSFSTFAGNPYFISLEALIEEGVLTEEECAAVNFGTDPIDINYEAIYYGRYPLLRLAYQRSKISENPDYQAFLAENRWWLDDYALFMALKDRFGGSCWNEWPEDIRLRRDYALDYYRRELYFDIEFQMYMQFKFFQQYRALKAYANENGIQIVGDIPIYVAMDSADTWANPELFQLNEENIPTAVAGCPPDGFSADGQLWGNPLFRWERMAENGYAWWMRRIEFQFRICDTLRIDHFRGFDEYYAIPYGDTTARNGRWKPGPGKDFFRVLNETLGPRSIIAEDLGFLTESVKELLAYTGYPGMKILQFGFDSREPGSSYLPHCCPTNCVLYAGTHDNDTVAAWLNTITEEDRAYAMAYMRLTEAEGWCTGVARTIWSNTADLTILQIQDILGLGSESRINTPSTLGCNWKWRLLPGQCSDALARELHAEMALYGRLP